MYNIISSIISHTWQTNYSGDQQYVYYICGALIIILTVGFIDLIKDVFSAFFRG